MEKDSIIDWIYEDQEDSYVVSESGCHTFCERIHAEDNISIVGRMQSKPFFS